LKRAGPPQPIFPSTRDDNSPQISPDGRELVFISNRSGFDEIWRGDLAQSQEPQLLTSLGSSGLYPHFPHWSPEGHFIVFSAAATSIRNVEGSVGHDISQIYVIPVEGPGPMRRLTAWNSEQTHPTWSSNGRWIYFTSNRSGKFELWKLPSDAPGAVKGDDNMMAALQLTHHGCTAGQESLDGETLFMKREDWSEGPVWAQAIEADPDSAKLVTLNAFTREWWSPSNRGIFYVDTSNATRADLPSTAPKPIFFFDWRTRQSSKIGEIRERFFVFRSDFCASPDGKKLIYTQFVIKNIDLMLVRDFY
jgi:Tol biopolymer transport system component